MAEICRAEERFHTFVPGIETWHAFSYGRHYDPERIGVGPLIAFNEERLDPGAGYDSHRHSDVDILTWVVSGRLRHEDSTGVSGEVASGTVQYLAAGSGVEHTEMNASDTEPVVFLQMMVRSRHAAAPEYRHIKVPDAPGLHAGPAVHADAQMFVVRLDTSRATVLPPGDAYFVHVVRGSVSVSGVTLTTGDSWASAATGPPKLSAAGESEAVAWVVNSADTR